MNFLENYLLNQRNKPQQVDLPPMQTPEQFAQSQKLEQDKQTLAEKLQQSGSPMRGLQNFLIHPGNALFGAKAPQQEVPISYQQPIVGVDMTQNDYNHAQEQGLLPGQGIVSMGVKENPRVGGLFNDIANGARENAQNSFSLNNIGDNQTSDGRNKGLGYRLGEALGTAGRFANSPAGRMALTGLAVGATGGNPTQAMTYGLQAGLGNYNNVQQDKMNRQLLQSQGIDTSGMRGYLNNDMAKSYTENYNRLNNSYYRMGKLSIEQRKELRLQGYTDAQIDRMEAQTETEKERPALIRAQTGLTKAKEETTLNPRAKKTISYKSGHTVVDINHNGNGKSGGSPKTKTSTPKPTSGDYYF